MRTIAIVNQKGGCGKTTTAINLAALYAKRGMRTLLVDMDPQSHCAAGLGVPESRIEYSIGDALTADLTHGFDPSPLVWEVSRNLFLAPSTMMLAALEAPGGGLHQLPDRDCRLEKLLGHMASQYDRCLIDCPPTIGLLTFNALRAAREALIPVETGFFSLRGAEKQWTTIQRMINHIGRPIACHMLATLHNPQSRLSSNILHALQRQYAGQILPVVIHEHEVLREAASFGQPVLEFAPDSPACHDFELLVDWLEEHAARPLVEIEVLSQRNGAWPNGADGEHHQHSSSHHAQRAFHAVSAGELRDGSMLAGSRAAELARRVHELAARSAARLQKDAPAANAPVAAATAAAAATTAAPSATAAIVENQSHPAPTPSAAPLRESQQHDAAPAGEQSMSHLFGVRQTSRGVLFVQPRDAGRTIAVAGDFNHWSPIAHRLEFNEHAGVHQAIIELPAGCHRYRLVIDGRWVADPYNARQEYNSYGEPISVVEIKASGLA